MGQLTCFPVNCPTVIPTGGDGKTETQNSPDVPPGVNKAGSAVMPPNEAWLQVQISSHIPLYILTLSPLLHHICMLWAY